MKSSWCWSAQDILADSVGASLPDILKLWTRELYDPNDRLEVILHVEKVA